MAQNNNQDGFTIIEILVALVMGSIFFTAICALIIDQTETHEDHQMKVMMQQNGRAALSVISNELMIAGYSPAPGVQAGIQTAAIDEIEYNYVKNDGSIESVAFSYVDGDDRIGLSRDSGDRESLLRNVEAFRVLYGSDLQGSGFDGYGALEVNSSGDMIWAYSSQNDETLDAYYILNSNGTMTHGTGISFSIDHIRAAKIWLLIRSNKKKNKYQSEVTISSLPGDEVTLDPDYSYRLYTTTVKLRNMYY